MGEWRKKEREKEMERGRGGGRELKVGMYIRIYQNSICIL